MKKIMILGAGIYQVPLIKKAKNMGLYTIVCSINGDYPGFKYADKTYYIDTTDTEKLLEIAIKEKISGICTSGTDVAVKSIGYINDRLGLNGISYKSATYATNKYEMKMRFQQKGVKSSKFNRVFSIEDAYNSWEQLKKPVVLKIVDKSGSRGIFKIEKKEDIANAFNSAKKITNTDYMIMEEFVVGTEVGIDAFVKKGKLVFVLPHEKIVKNNGASNVPVGHIFPLILKKEIEKRIYIEVKKIVEALKLNDCAINIDAFITENEDISIIEAGGRAGATGIPELISLYTGVDYYEYMINIALGNNIDFNSSYSNLYYACELIMPIKKGFIKDIKISNLTDNDISLDKKVGDYVEGFKNGTSRIGQIIVKGKNRQDCLNNLKCSMNSISMEIE